MKAGIGSYAFRYALNHPELDVKDQMSLDAIISFCEENAVEALQICDNMPIHSMTEAALINAAARARNLEIVIEMGTVGLESKNMHRYLKLCTMFNAAILRTIINSGTSRYNKGETMKHIRKIIPALEKDGVILAIENHFDLCPENLAKLILEFNHPLVRICLDPLNSITNLWGSKETIDKLCEFTVSAHIKDIQIVRHGAGFLVKGCPLGMGIADLQSYVNKVFSANSQCNVFVEQWMDAEETLANTLQTEKNWVTHGIQFVKKIIPDCTQQGLEHAPINI